MNDIRHCESPLLYFGGEAISTTLKGIASGKSKSALAMTNHK